MIKVPAKWKDYVLTQHRQFDDFWAAHFAERERNVLVIAGVGFDPRATLVSERLLAAGGVGRRECWGIELPSTQSAGSWQGNAAGGNRDQLLALYGDDSISLHHIDLVDGQRRIGGRQAAALIVLDDIAAYTDIVLDISALPRGVHMSLLGKLLFLADERGFGGNIHLCVAENPQLDEFISEVDIDEVAHFAHGFAKALSAEADLHIPRLLMPMLGIGRREHLNRVIELVNPDAIYPIFPSPAANPRQADILYGEYAPTLLGEADDPRTIDPRRIIFVCESNPFEACREITRAACGYTETLETLGGTRIAIAPLSTKLLAVGAVLAAHQFRGTGVDISIANVDANAYDFDGASTDPEQARDAARLHALWLTGECYA